MLVIEGNSALRQCIPNTMASAAGEPTLYLKLYPYLEQAEQWLVDNITGQEVLNVIATMKDIDTPRYLAAKVITCHALSLAVPSLDLVLTANGFGIVNTGNIAPASKDRVERLMASLVDGRDANLGSLLFRLHGFSGWVDTPQAAFFGSTLFPDFSICRKLLIKTDHWNNYCSLRSKLIAIENDLAEKFFSQELMASLRSEVLRRTFHLPLRSKVIDSIRSIEVMLLSDVKVQQQSYFDIVNIIRENETVFPEWHNSATAELYTPPVFRNEKESHGYWF